MEHVDNSNIATFNWVMVSKYCNYTGDTRDAINARRARGEWLEGIHYTIRKRRVWINLDEVKQWLLKSQ